MPRYQATLSTLSTPVTGPRVTPSGLRIYTVLRSSSTSEALIPAVAALFAAARVMEHRIGRTTVTCQEPTQPLLTD